MFFRRLFRNANDKVAERRHREERRWALRNIELAQQNRNLQLTAIIMAAIGVLVTILLAWPSSPKHATPKAKVTLVPVAQNAVIPSPISRISSPPPYPAKDIIDHCGDWWTSWLTRQEAAPAPPDLFVEISAPANANATVTSASLKIIRAFVPPKVSHIRCLVTGGATPGTLLYVNLVHPANRPTIVSDTGETVPLLSMPDAVINISAGNTEYINISPTGKLGWFYAWSVTLTVVVDQRSTAITFGSKRHPLFSWFGSTSSLSYDYSFAHHSWEKVR